MYRPQTKRYEYQAGDHSCKVPDICGKYVVRIETVFNAFVTDSSRSSSRALQLNIANRLNYTKTAKFKIHPQECRGMSNDNIQNYD
jgi:hypothetical protein